MDALTLLFVLIVFYLITRPITVRGLLGATAFVIVSALLLLFLSA